MADYKVVFHLDWDDEKRLNMALKNITRLLVHLNPGEADIRVVINGKAVRLLKKLAPEKRIHRIEALHEKGVKFHLCHNAIADSGKAESDYLQFCEVVPNGILDLMQLQKEGFAYIKP